MGDSLLKGIFMQNKGYRKLLEQFAILSRLARASSEEVSKKCLKCLKKEIKRFKKSGNKGTVEGGATKPPKKKRGFKGVGVGRNSKPINEAPATTH